MRIKFEITLKGEYEFDTSYYPEGMTAEEMAKVDEGLFSDDHFEALAACRKFRVTVTPKTGGSYGDVPKRSSAEQ